MTPRDPFGPDSPAPDAHGMTARVRGVPEQIEAALAACGEEPWSVPDGAPELVAVGALGGSAIAADLTAHALAEWLARPLLVVRDDRWPHWLGPRALALLASYSGETQETLALYDEAASRGVPRLALTTGGALAARCTRDGVTWARLPQGSPPRAAVYAGWVRITALLYALGWLADPAPAWREAIALLRRRGDEWQPESDTGRNPVKQAALRLSGRFPFIYAATHLGAVATRLRNQLNENAKLLAHSAVVPELDHNEIVGWERASGLASHAAALILRDGAEAPETERRLGLIAEEVRERGAEVVEVTLPEGSSLARAASLVLFGDWLSLYLARLGEVDPTPIVSIDRFKRKLARTG